MSDSPDTPPVDERDPASEPAMDWAPEDLSAQIADADSPEALDDDHVGELVESETEAAESAVEAEEAEQQPVEAESEAGPEVAAALEGLNVRLEEALRLQARQLEISDRLHAENQSLKQGELRTAMLPLVREVVRLRDQVERMRETVRDERAADLELVLNGLVEALARTGVISFVPESGSAFDPAEHNAVAIEPSDDPTLSRRVAASLRPGFRWESGPMIRAADVAVYKPRVDQSDT